MKFSEFINEGKERSLIGMEINGELMTPDVQNNPWNGNFECFSQALTSLKGAPKIIKGDFDCSHNKLTSLKGGPKEVHGVFFGYENELTSLKGAPKKVDGAFNVNDNKLTSLEGMPEIINGDLSFNNNRITSLKDIHKFIKHINDTIFCINNPIESHVLGLLLIPGLKRISSGTTWSNILNKYVGKGRAGLIDCQNELLDAGLEEFAQL